MNLHKQRCFAQASDRDRQAQRVPDPKAQDSESLSRGEGGGVMGGGGLCEGVSGGGLTPGGFFDSSRRIFRRIFLADFSFVFCDQKNPPQNPPQNPPLCGEFLFQKSPGLEAPEIHRPPPPPPRESKSNSCAFGSGTVTFQGGSFQKRLQV